MIRVEMDIEALKAARKELQTDQQIQMDVWMLD
jgi:hypothetical protein